MSEFNLLEEKWLKVLDDTEVKEVTLYDLFENAHEYNALAGELPTQDFAVLRFLLAVMYGSFYRNIKEPDDAYILWEDMFKAKKFDVEKIKNYLEPFKHRFYLFDDEFPFYQVINIKGTDGFARKLNGEIDESGSKEDDVQKLRIFSTYSGKTKNELSFSDTARWLLNFIGYTDSSGKPHRKIETNEGSKKIKKVGWLGQLGGVYAEGKNLFETLMYNFCILNESNEPFELGQAVWEKSVERYEHNYINTSKDILSLLTLQSRRIILKRKNEKVIGYSFLGGDYFRNNGKNAFNIEQMTIWENKSSTTDNKNGELSFFPKMHNASKLFWNGLDFFLIDKINEEKRIIPGIINNIARLQRRNILKKSRLRICAVGMIYVDKKSAIKNIYKDRLVFDSELLTESGTAWANRICAEVKITDDLVKAYGNLAGDLYIATGGDKGKNDAQLYKIQNKEKEEAYFMLDIPFRNWLESVSAEDNMEDKTMEWWNISSEIIKKAKDKLISRYNFKICKEHSGKECYSSISKFEYITQSKEVFMNYGKKSK